MLNELILKYSESLEKLNLKHLKELFVGGDDEDLEGMDEEEYNQLRAEMEAERQEDDEYSEDEEHDQPPQEAPKEESEKYSSDDSDDKFGLRDIGELKKRNMRKEKDDEENYEKDDFEFWFQ